LGIDASGRVSLQGESPQATKVLKWMGASPYLDDPGFQGVIQTDARTGKERFYMTAQLRTMTGGGKPAHATSTQRGADAQAERH
jgi:general secretion pathway protein L